AERGAQFMDRECARVYDAVGQLAQLAERLALAANPVLDGPADRRGMRAPRLAEPPHEHVVARFEVHHLEADAGPADLVERVAEAAQEEPLARVDAERDAMDFFARALPQLDEAREERDGQVVDAVEPQVLEHAQRR